MEQTPLKNQIIDWLKHSQYWFQHAGNTILETKEVSDALITQTYQYFKEDLGLVPAAVDLPEIKYNEIAVAPAGVSAPLHLTAIKNIRHVNALTQDQSISIGKNLTVIYGGNGAGKSGYIRLLNNAFDSRGDKKILQNVFVPAPALQVTPSCTFSFEDGVSAGYDLNFPADSGNSAFSQFSIFDTHSVRVHLENDNKLNFTPTGFEFFEHLVKLYEELKIKLTAEININRPANPYAATFLNENSVKDLISGLNAASDEELIKKTAAVNAQEVEEYEKWQNQRSELIALDIPKKTTELQGLKNSFSTFASGQQAILDCLTDSAIEEYTRLIAEYTAFKELTLKEGTEKFEHLNIHGLGSQRWQDFITSARAYAEMIEKYRDGHEYPGPGDHCLLCLRPLSETEDALMKSYWSLLKSAAGTELQRVENLINAAVAKLNSLTDIVFDENTILYKALHADAPELALRWKEACKQAIALKKDVVTNLADREVKVSVKGLPYHTQELDLTIKGIDTKIDSLLSSNPTTELAELNKKISLIDDRKRLAGILVPVLKLVQSYKWAAKADTALSAFNTIAITKKQGELFGQHVTEKYTTFFNTECARLNAPNVVKVVQKNSKITSMRKLQINGVGANNILSEGEQRVISLADFITEVQLNPNNKGIIFDDPVTSQDHVRKEIIADRIAALAKDRQVIVFTHDIGFFIRLQLTSESIGVPFSFTTMRNVMGSPGIINPNIPWVAQKISERIKYLRNDLSELRKIEKTGDSDRYFIAVKSWYGLLREGWERAVEERLFKGVIERFGLGIQTQRLKKVVITDEFLTDIETGMTISSNWAHDAASARNPEPPDTNQAEADLNALDAFAKKCAAP